MKRIAIVGASGHGKVVADVASLLGWEVIEFFDDRWPQMQHNDHWPVSGSSETLHNRMKEFDCFIIAIGDNQTRLSKLEDFTTHREKIGTLVHPRAVVSHYSEIGRGAVIFANAVVNPGAHVGDGVIINTGALIDHDCLIGNGVHVSPGAVLAGGVSIGDCSWIGMGACVRQMISVGERSIVGMGAVVIRNVPNDVTVVGNPAHVITSH